MNFKMIYDPFHGNIEVSKFETQFLRTPLLNRLHQILQNSAAYLVYPCCKTSRFEHSIGTMDYAGGIYLNGINNSDVSKGFLLDKSGLIKTLVEDPTNYWKFFSCLDKGGGKKYGIKKKILDAAKADNYSELLSSDLFLKHLKKFIGDDFVNRNITDKFLDTASSTKKQRIELEAINLILFQSVRIFGLLHDVGHMPFSHLFEFSIESIYSKLVDKGKDATPFEIEIKNHIENITTQGDQLHEVIGKNITQHILIDIKENLHDGKNSTDNLMAILCCSIFELVLEEIREGEDGQLNSLYCIISNSIDADRLDFVQRDGSVSGIAKETGNIDRIIKMFCLAILPLEGITSPDKYAFLPGLQSLHDIEQVIKDRFNIYKYLVNHHAVKRSDFLFQKVIENRIFKELSEEKQLKGDLKVEGILDAIVIASEIANPVSIDEYKALIYSFLQITDFWILSLLNEEFITSINSTDEPNEEDFLIKEIYENKRSFISLWKRRHEFDIFAQNLGQSVIKSWSISEDLNEYDFEKTADGQSIFKEILKIYNKLNREGVIIKEEEILLKKHEAHLNKTLKSEDPAKTESIKKNNDLEVLGLKKILTLKVDKYNEKLLQLGLKTFDLYKLKYKQNSWVSGIQKELIDDKRLILVAPAKLKHGIENLWLIDNRDQSICKKFEYASLTAESLKRELVYAIRFFIYFCPKNQKINMKETAIMKEQIIKLTVEFMKQYFFSSVKTFEKT